MSVSSYRDIKIAYALQRLESEPSGRGSIWGEAIPRNVWPRWKDWYGSLRTFKKNNPESVVRAKNSKPDLEGLRRRAPRQTSGVKATSSSCKRTPY